jgi:hypothetical protein
MSTRPDLGTFDGIRQRLAGIKALLDDFSKTAIATADLEDLMICLASFERTLDYATPTETCPFCFGRGEGCRFCHGIGYVSKDKLKLAPIEMVAMAERMNGE